MHFIQFTVPGGRILCLLVRDDSHDTLVRWYGIVQVIRVKKQTLLSFHKSGSWNIVTLNSRRLVMPCELF